MKTMTVLQVHKKSDKIVGYTLKDSKGRAIKISPDELKENLRYCRIRLTNYHLTIDNRIVKGKDYLSSEDKLFQKWYDKWKMEEKPFPFVCVVGQRVFKSHNWLEPDGYEDVEENIFEDDISDEWIEYLDEEMYSDGISFDCTYAEFKAEIKRVFEYFKDCYSEKRMQSYNEE